MSIQVSYVCMKPENSPTNRFLATILWIHRNYLALLNRVPLAPRTCCIPRIKCSRSQPKMARERVQTSAFCTQASSTHTRRGIGFSANNVLSGGQPSTITVREKRTQGTCWEKLIAAASQPLLGATSSGSASLDFSVLSRFAILYLRPIICHIFTRTTRRLIILHPAEFLRLQNPCM